MGGRWVVVVMLSAALFVGCSDAATTTSGPAATPTTAAPDAATTTSGPAATTVPPTTAGAPLQRIVDWVEPANAVDLDGGWTIGACQGDAPLLCVERDGAAVGVVEALAFPVSSFPDLDPAAGDAANLRNFTAGFLATYAEDRAAGCGADYAFQPIDPEPIDLGGTPGIAYGFSGHLATGEPSELHLHHAAIVGDDVISIVASGYDEGGCPGRDDLSTWDSATLAEFRPHLHAVLQATPLPDVP